LAAARGHRAADRCPVCSARTSPSRRWPRVCPGWGWCA
jgi:hypothetical protein